jgi:glutamyl-tRNA synthetase
VKKHLAKNEGEGFAMLRQLRPQLAGLESWSGAAAHGLMQQLAQARDLKMGKVAQPVRVAVSGKAATPEIDKTLAILGQKQTLQRIDMCLAEVEPRFMQPSNA